MFTRGQTQICDVCTLAPLSEQQKLDGLDEHEVSKRYMHHYNFPSYSVGETKPSRGPGRREIGHGALAERALVPVLPSEEEFPYTIRCVSETFESNGSTSMASTCASCMSLMAAGVPIKKMVAGISCGLVTGETDDDFVLLTDIQGLEDFFGDMTDLITGTTDGITAIQMDIKIHGLTRPIVEGAIARCREARLFIMDNCMKPCIAEPRKEVGEYAPKIIQMSIDPQKIGDVVGQRGKTINAIIEQTGVKIDITDDGSVSICGTDKAMMDKAKELINIIVSEFEEGQVYVGKVVSIKEFGAFLEFAPGKEGMVHISKIAKERINHVEDVLTLGDVVKVVCLGKDKMGRISFSIKDVKEEPGYGVHAFVDGLEVYAGNTRLMNREGILYAQTEKDGTAVHVAVDGKYAGYILIADTIRKDTGKLMRWMRKKNMGTVMLTGDRQAAADAVAAELGIDEVHAELLPADKVGQVEKLLGAQNEKERLAFVGDGINDAPVLTRADIGIAMGSMGSDAAIEAADIVLMDDDIRKIASLVKIARKTLGIVKQNIVFALAVKALVLLLGALGMANMWEAVFADVGVSVIAILNSMRTLNTK